jgi:hypothetical protein
VPRAADLAPLGILTPLAFNISRTTCCQKAHNLLASPHGILCLEPEKNARLKEERGVGFEAVVFHIERGDLLDILQHPSQARYAGQRIFVVNIDDDAYLVPFAEGAGEVFLKTIIPSRKATNIYLRRRREDG